MNKIIFIILALLSITGTLSARTCTSNDYDKAEYYSDQAAKKIVRKYGGGNDIRMELRSCSYNSYSNEFKTTINVYWNGSIFSSNHYNVDGELKFKSDGTLINFSKTYQNSNVDDLDFFGNVITFTAAIASLDENYIYVTNNCSSKIELKVHYKDPNRGWITKEWWTFDSGESGKLKSGGSLIHTNNAILYYYAQKASTGSRISSYDIKIDGYRMQKVVDKQGATQFTVCE